MANNRFAHTMVLGCGISVNVNQIETERAWFVRSTFEEYIN